MSSFLAGLFTGSLIGVVVTLLILLIVAGFKGSEPNRKNKLSIPKVYLTATVLLTICAVCYTFDLEKSALLALLLSVLLITKLGGSKQGIAAAALAAVILAWFLPPQVVQFRLSAWITASPWLCSSWGRSWVAVLSKEMCD